MLLAIEELNQDYQKAVDLLNTPKYNLCDVLRPIEINIASPGGCLYSGLGLCDFIIRQNNDTSKPRINTHVFSYTFSAGLLIATAGYYRTASKTAKFMYHQLSSTQDGELHELKSEIELLDVMQGQADDIITSRTKIKQTRLTAALKKKENWYFDAVTAKNMGVIHDII